MGFRIESYAQAKAYGLEHLWADKTSKTAMPEAAPPPSQFIEDGLNKLERAFWERLQVAQREMVFREIHNHELKLRVVGSRWYTPDFHAATSVDVTIFETKGWMREDAALKLLAAAERYPAFRWVLVTRQKRIWQCRYVTNRGISRELWCPDWLR